MKHYNHLRIGTVLLLSLGAIATLFTGCGKKESSSEVLTLRVCNWEEYIDEGDWAKEDAIPLENKTIRGKNAMITDFEHWYQKQTGKKIRVEYSCFGTNEELYNQLTLGDHFDLVCPSEYMIMKLLMEKKLEAFDDTFFDTSEKQNYYSRGVAPYIRSLTRSIQINHTSLDKYAAGYMWGTTGIVYNPDKVSAKEASSWKILTNPKFRCRVTIKDNVRDAYFAAIGILKSDTLKTMWQNARTDSTAAGQERYQQQLRSEMNDTSKDTVTAVEHLLQKNKRNFYSFETDSGKADMITGKVLANYQWSGDAVYTMDQADEDNYTLCYSVPEESSNLWFDGWVMLKDGIAGNTEKKQAAQAFINFLSRPDNVVRNMDYIGYTSAITGGEDDTIFQYANWCYGAEETDTDTFDYDLSYFFAPDSSKSRKKKYVITADKSQINRQLFAQYPPEEVLKRCTIMEYFGDTTNRRLNQMWINVRCFNPFLKN